MEGGIVLAEGVLLEGDGAHSEGAAVSEAQAAAAVPDLSAVPLEVLAVPLVRADLSEVVEPDPEAPLIPSAVPHEAMGAVLAEAGVLDRPRLHIPRPRTLMAAGPILPIDMAAGVITATHGADHPGTTTLHSTPPGISILPTQDQEGTTTLVDSTGSTLY